MRFALAITAVLVFAASSVAFAKGGGHSHSSSSHSHSSSYRAPSSSSNSSVYVKGYTTNNGTYVAPHYRTTPDNTQMNNWSSKPNVNPYTGQEGTKTPKY